MGSMYSPSARLISIHALREEGDPAWATPSTSRANFNPRPPRGGRPFRARTCARVCNISIHALREESDKSKRTESKAEYVFQSTPSARRATHRLLQGSQGGHDFNPRPPRGGRPGAVFNAISPALFQSTPSARRATRTGDPYGKAMGISIHALREESDWEKLLEVPANGYFNPRPPRGERPNGLLIMLDDLDFNPRPPRGERPLTVQQLAICGQFQSTPSARRATVLAVSSFLLS